MAYRYAYGLFYFAGVGAIVDNPSPQSCAEHCSPALTQNGPEAQQLFASFLLYLRKSPARGDSLLHPPHTVRLYIDGPKNIPPTPPSTKVPRLYFTAREVPVAEEKTETGVEEDHAAEGGGVLVERGGGVAADGVGRGGKQALLARRPVVMSRAMRDFAGLDQVFEARLA